MIEKSYLGYYGKLGIIPVRQNIENLALHSARRRSLYRLLGLQARDFRNASVLEFGPGTGDNAIYVASCGLERYVLVDGNPASVEAISDKIQQGVLPSDRVECHQRSILGYQDERRFQVVLCEGVIPMQANPEAFLTHVASFVAPEGFLVITTVSPAGILAEVCRRVLKTVIGRRFTAEGELLKELVRFFEPDLLSLPGMSRLPEDWVLDNILHPWAERFTFTMPEAIGTLTPDFDVHGSSPRFMQDWRWYKSVPEDGKSWNEVALDEYDRWAGYMLDYRVRPAMPWRGKAADLDAACVEAIRIHHTVWHDNRLDLIPHFVDRLKGIGDMVSQEMPTTARSVTDYLSGLGRLLNGDDQADFGTFRFWFGRGQQYVSFVRGEK